MLSIFILLPSAPPSLCRICHRAHRTPPLYKACFLLSRARDRRHPGLDGQHPVTIPVQAQQAQHPGPSPPPRATATVGDALLESHDKQRLASATNKQRTRRSATQQVAGIKQEVAQPKQEEAEPQQEVAEQGG
jgi:hypothetical protein